MAADRTTTISQSIDVGAAGSLGAERELPRLVFAFECRKPFASGVRCTLAGIDEVTIGRGMERGWRRDGKRLEIKVSDHESSRSHASIVRHDDGWELTDLKSKNGTVVNGINVVRAMLTDGDVIEIGGAVFVYRDDGRGARCFADRDLKAVELPPAFATLSLEVEDCANKLAKIAPSNAPVLIQGETGTGKEVTAQAIHRLSGRRGGFVPVNCGALPRNLIESELFGHKRGAFSGARDDRDGLVRRADGGTLFLDEIAELPEESQVSLLRVLQEGEVRPLGATDIMHVEVRIIAATHRDLGSLVAEGRFRQDLYGRLIGYVAEIPPLRERREDIGALIGALLVRVGAGRAIAFDKQAARALMLYPYPLNIRELEQALRGAVALAEGREIRVEHLPEAIRGYRRDTTLLAQDEALRARLAELLAMHRGNVAAVGRALGKAPVQIRRWCSRLALPISSFRD